VGQSGEEQVLRGLLQQAFEIIASSNVSEDAPVEVQLHVRGWLLQSHAMLCETENHKDEIVTLIRMYNAASN
jgi:hypothetical protein